MKRLVCILFVLVLAIGISVAESVDLESMPLQDLQRLYKRVEAELASRYSSGDAFYEDSKISIIYMRTLVGKSLGDNIVVVQFQITNIGSSTVEFYPNVYIEIYQDGVKLDPATLSDYYKLGSVKLRPSGCATFYVPCKLRNTTSPVLVCYENAEMTLSIATR